MALSLIRDYESDGSSENEEPPSVARSKMKTPTMPVEEATTSTTTLDIEKDVAHSPQSFFSRNMSDEDKETLVESDFNAADAKFSEQQSRNDRVYISDSDKSSSTESADDSDNNWESFDDSEDDEILDNSNRNTKTFNKNSRPFIKVKGELDLEDLPPVEDLKISVSRQDCEIIGHIFKAVKTLVIVQSLPNKPSLDLDTVLFLDNGNKVLGQIFDVFGQVNQPLYSVRFNSPDHVQDKSIAIGMNVYYAPKSDHTRFIVVSDLMRLKGSDASWQHDLEMPPEFLDYSDDEKEREAKRENQRKKTQGDGSSSGSSNKRAKPTEFEEKMNRKNLQKTAEWDRKNKQTGQKLWKGVGRGNPFGFENNVFNANFPTADIHWAGNSNSNPSVTNQLASDNTNGNNLPYVYNLIPQFNNATFIRPSRLTIPPMFRPPSMTYQGFPPNMHVPAFYSNVSANIHSPNATSSMSHLMNTFTSPPPNSSLRGRSRTASAMSGQSQEATVTSRRGRGATVIGRGQGFPKWPDYSFPAPPGT